jgi:steroid 5-alpha reductase family enzyme
VSPLLRFLVLAYATAFAVAAAVVWGLPGHSPLTVAALADLAATVVIFAFSVWANNSSIYDPYWSVAPVPIVLSWAAPAFGWRQALICALVFAWGARLTFNCLARWRSLRDEDFRYLEIRERTGRLYWPASFFSIHLFPSVWVFLGLLPLYPALTRTPTALGVLDVLAFVTVAGAIALETVADGELRAFLRGRSSADAVLDRGLWAVSRHPNYLGELLFWWGLFLFGLAGGARSWSAVGPLAISLLFLFVSVPWMDRRMEARHPGWAARRAGTPGLIPWRLGLWRGS